MARRRGGTNPVTTNTTTPASTMANRLVVYSSIAPHANVALPASSEMPDRAERRHERHGDRHAGKRRRGILADRRVRPGGPRSERHDEVADVGRRATRDLVREFTVDEQRREYVRQHDRPQVASTTTPNDRSDLRNNAMAMHAAVPSTGCMSGASSIAPMTTAAESADNPITATITDSVIITVNRKAQCSWRLIASSAITRWRSSESGGGATNVRVFRRWTPRLGSSDGSGAAGSVESSRCSSDSMPAPSKPVGPEKPRGCTTWPILETPSGRHTRCVRHNRVRPGLGQRVLGARLAHGRLRPDHPGRFRHRRHRRRRPHRRRGGRRRHHRRGGRSRRERRSRDRRRRRARDPRHRRHPLALRRPGHLGRTVAAVVVARRDHRGHRQLRCRVRAGARRRPRQADRVDGGRRGHPGRRAARGAAVELELVRRVPRRRRLDPPRHRRRHAGARTARFA